MPEYPTLAQLLDRLFKTRRKPDGSEYTTYEVARAIQECGYGTVNASHIAKLRRGETANPSRNLLLSLCLFFEVSPTYFFPELTNVPTSAVPHNADEQMRAALRNVGLQPNAQLHIEALIELLRHNPLPGEPDGADSNGL